MTSKAPSSGKSSTTSTPSSNQSEQPPQQQENSCLKTYRAYNAYDVKAASDEAVLPAEQYGESLTIQAHAADADLNELMRRYGITGRMPENVRIPTYGDFTQITDYRSALEAVRHAKEGFMEIPADVRARFNNDPQLFMEFCDDPRNMPAMVQLGIAKLRPPPPGSTAPPSPSHTPSGTAQTATPTPTAAGATTTPST